MLRAGCFVFITWLSLTANATPAPKFDFLPSGGGPEKEFQSLMSSGNSHQALMAWTAAHSGSNFGRSDNGIATYAYLLLQNDMPYTATQMVIQETQPSRLNAELLKFWTAEIKSSVFVQKGWIQTAGGWRQIVNNDSVMLTIRSKKDASAALAQAERLPKDQANAKARIWWQIATLAPQVGDIDDSLKALKLMRDSGQNVIGQDLVASASARVLYQKGDIDGAQVYFNQIPKGSTIWVESVEERAWADLRKDDFDKALGEVATLMSGTLSPLVGPESYFLSNLMSLKVCDYPRLFKTSELFKKRHRDRLIDIQELAKNGSNKNMPALFEKFEQNGVSLESAGPLVISLPRQALRDARFVRAMEIRRRMLSESQAAAALSSSAGALGGGAELDRLAAQDRSLADKMRQQASSRVRVLAQGEVKEYRVLLNKMHIIEGEVIERLHLDDNLKGQRSRLSKTEDTGDVLVFAVKGNETWIDELDNYKARVKDCPTLKGASL